MKTPVTLAAAVLGLASALPAQTIGQLEFVDSFVDVPDSVVAELGALLPEMNQAAAAFLSDAYDPNLVLSEGATVSVTFVWEGAGWRNALGYFTYEQDDFGAITILDRQLVFPNVSFPSAGQLETGDTVTLRDADGAIRIFEDGTRIGFFLVGNGWPTNTVKSWNPLTAAVPSESASVNASAANGVVTTIDALNPSSLVSPDFARHVAMIKLPGTPGFLGGDDVLVVGFEDVNRSWSNSDEDFNDAMFVVTSTPPEAIADTNVLVADADDVDEDGVSGTDDAYPTDDERALVTKYPALGYNQLGFEDNYPDLGDADYNDAVVSYDFLTTTRADGAVKEILGTFHLLARGAAYDSLFGLHMPGLPEGTTGTVTIERFLSDDAGTREVVERSVTQMIADGKRIDDVFPSTKAALPPVPGKFYINTENGDVDRLAASSRVRITFDQAVDATLLGGVPYDLYFGVKRGADVFDVHLPGVSGLDDRPAYLPEEEGELAFLDDETGAPWMIEVPAGWRHPREAVHVTNAFVDFADWAASNGVLNAAWFETPTEMLVSPTQSELIPLREWSVKLAAP